MEKFKFNSKIIICTFFITLLFSCKKDFKTEGAKSHDTKNIQIVQKSEPLNIDNSKFSTSALNSNSQYGSIQDIIRAYGVRPPIEPSLAGSPDSVNLINYNMEVANYLQKYPLVGPIDPAYTRDPDFFFVTLVYSCLEESGALNNGTIVQNRMPTWLNCVGSVVIGYFDIMAVIRNLGSVSIQSVWTITKSLITRYVGAISAGFLLYNIATNCL
jgi:hypothetical protein